MVVATDLIADPSLAANYWPLFLLQLFVVLLLSKLLILLLSPLRQPPVVAQIIVGLLIGPSVLGNSSTWNTHVFPSTSWNTMTTVANLGIIFFVWTTFIRIDLQAMKARARSTVPTALTCIAIPFAIGCGVAQWLYDINKDDEVKPVNKTAFTLFVASCFSFTAAPILASLLAISGKVYQPVGIQAMSCALVDDVVAWILLAISTGFAKGSSINGLYVFFVVMAYIATYTLLIGPALRWVFYMHVKGHPERHDLFTWLALMVLITSAFFAESIGIKAFFGAFLAALICPKDDEWSKPLPERMSIITREILLPIFFANNGMRTNVGLLDTGYYIGATIAVFIIAVLSKVVPATLMTRYTSKGDWRFSLAVGVCMNTKGMIELVALNVGLNLNIISPRIFTMLVIMALLTTFIVSPSIYILYERLAPSPIKTVDADAHTENGLPGKLALHPELQPSSSSSQLVLSPTSASKADFVEMSSPKGGGYKEEYKEQAHVVRMHGDEEEDK